MNHNVPPNESHQIITLDRPGSVTTESSIYAFDGRCRYQRLPRHESGPRSATPCIDDSLDDGRWIEYREVWIENHPFVPGHSRLGIVPSQRAENFQGIRTGAIVASTYKQIQHRLTKPTLRLDTAADDDIRRDKERRHSQLAAKDADEFRHARCICEQGVAGEAHAV